MFPLRLSRSSSEALASFDASSSFGWSRLILSTAEPAPEGDRRHDLAHIGGHVVGDGVPERRVLEPTGTREHVRGPDVIPTATVKGAREGARVGIMSVGCPRTAGRATKSGQDPNPVDVS